MSDKAFYTALLIIVLWAFVMIATPRDKKPIEERLGLPTTNVHANHATQED